MNPHCSQPQVCLFNRNRVILRILSVVYASSLNYIDPAISIPLLFAVFVLTISFLVTSSPASSCCVLLFLCPSYSLFYITLALSNSFYPHSKFYLCLHMSIHPSLLLCPCQTLPPFSALLWSISSTQAPPCCTSRSGCPNLPSRMTMQSRMAIRAPVLRPAEERNASPWHIRILPWRWHGQTRRVKVLVPLNDGSPLSHTTIGSSYSSWVRWLKRRRLAMMLAVLSVMIKNVEED